MRVFNTLTRQKEQLIPIEQGKIKMYACGPTVYNYIHIGNARPICVFDTLRRYLEYTGLEVTFVQNFTDIDDKIINKAALEGVTSQEIAQRYIAEYKIDAAGLCVRPATIQPLATDSIDTIIDIVRVLEEEGFAYNIDGDVYFSSRKFEDYGKLSGQPLEDLDAGNRIDVSSQKKDPLDFVVWKKAKPGEPHWTSPWGEGRPGWHIECSAMVKEFLGDTIDIHCGGQDLIFPHHENEIAQSECCNGLQYVNYWMHNGYINVDNRKMSKSLDNFFTVREVSAKFGYEPIKFMMLQSHYRSPINYSLDVIKQCAASLERLHTCRSSMEFALQNAVEQPTAGEDEFAEILTARKAQFIKAMDDDLNTADGIAAIFDLVRDINTLLAIPRSAKVITAANALFDELCDVLGIAEKRTAIKADDEIQTLIDQRQQARKDKDFALADSIRDTLAAKGITLEDTPQGARIVAGK